MIINFSLLKKTSIALMVIGLVFFNVSRINAETYKQEYYPYNFREDKKSSLYKIDINSPSSKIINTDKLLELNKYNMEIKEISLSIRLEIGEFFIGIITDKETSRNEIIEELTNQVLVVKEHIEESFSYCPSFSLLDFEYNYFVVETQLTKSDLNQLLCVLFDNITKTENVFSLVNLEDDLNIINSTENVNTINSCYHRQLFDNDGNTYTVYHNGINNTETRCLTNTSSPHLGDGNSRLLCGYKWMPTFVKVEFSTSVSSGKNRTKLTFSYSSSKNNLQYLKQDGNETLEMEVVFYNYTRNVTAENLGSTYQLLTGRSYSTNIPDYYLDTTFADNPNQISFCIGCHDATKLVNGTNYYWSIDSNSGTQVNSYPNDGRFKVVAQRGYHTSTSISTWNVFSEEHERSVILGISSGYNWVPQPYNAWYLSNNSLAWSYYDGDNYRY